MGSYWDASGRLVDGRYELSGSKVSEGIADMVLNTQGTLLASAARTATVQGPTLANYNARGIVVFLNVSVAPAAPGAGGLSVRIQSFDSITNYGLYMNVVPTVITTTGFYGFVVYPGASAAASGTSGVQQFTPSMIGRLFSIIINHGDAQAYTYSIGYSLVL